MATTHQSTDASSPQSTELPGDDLFQQGYALYKQENYSQAIRLFQQAVALGNPDATYCLGYMHRFAQGTPMNINEAWRFFQMIPEHPLVMVQLGGDYLCGIGVNRDDAKGKDYYEQVVARYSKNPSMIEAEAIANACGRLARIYQYGSGVPIDLDKAIELYLKGCQYAITADFVNEYFKEYISTMRDCQSDKLVENFARLITEVETLRQENQELNLIILRMVRATIKPVMIFIHSSNNHHHKFYPAERHLIPMIRCHKID